MSITTFNFNNPTINQSVHESEQRLIEGLEEIKHEVAKDLLEDVQEGPLSAFLSNRIHNLPQDWILAIQRKAVETINQWSLWLISDTMISYERGIFVNLRVKAFQVATSSNFIQILGLRNLNLRKEIAAWVNAKALENVLYNLDAHVNVRGTSISSLSSKDVSFLNQENSLQKGIECCAASVTDIDLSNSSLKSIPLSGNFPRLNYLDMSSNNLSQGRPFFFLADRLKYLAFHSCELSQVPDIQLFERLKFLELSRNRLTGFMNLSSYRSLKVVFAAHNALTNIILPPHLITGNFNGNLLKTAGAIQENLEKPKNLSLWVQENPIVRDPSAIAQLKMRYRKVTFERMSELLTDPDVDSDSFTSGTDSE